MTSPSEITSTGETTSDGRAAWRVFVAASFVMIVVGVTLFLIYRTRAVKETKRQSAETVQRYLPVARQGWSEHEFKAVVSDRDALAAALQAAVDRAKARYAKPLAGEPLERAQRDALLFFDGYAADDFASFMAFRRPVADFEHSPARVQGLRDRLRDDPWHNPAEVPESPDALFEYCWRRDDWCGKSFISSVALATINMAFGDVPDLPTVGDINDLLPGTPIMGVASYFPFYIFPDQPRIQKTADRGLFLAGAARKSAAGHRLTMTVACIAQKRKPDSPIPLVYRAYWSESYGRWLPLGVAEGSIYEKKWIPLF